MIYFASSESHVEVDAGLSRTYKAVTAYMKKMLPVSSLASLEATIRYIPIIMPDNLASWHPARSKLRKTQKLYDCAPVLNYQVFLNGTFEEQIREYIGGLPEVVPNLAALGATPEQIADFARILDEAVEHILANQLDNTRH